MGSTISAHQISAAIFLVFTARALAADGVDFSNNLFTDLGPLLALLGEQVAKQFMSQSLIWLEDVIFAMAPLGIITAVISAVRVGGPNWLRAVVGRARESRAVAEVELMSSTSHEVCELWNGEAIVPVMGSPDIAEILYFEGEADGLDGPRLFTLATAAEDGVLNRAKEMAKDGQAKVEEPACPGIASPPGEVAGISGGSRGCSVPVGADVEAAITGMRYRPRRSQKASPIHTILPRYTTPISAPNISLNFSGAKKKGELWLFAILGVVLQFGSLAFIGATRYHRKLDRGKGENSEYAYPLMASGTLMLVIGMMACSHVVQASSKEDLWVADGNFRILWLQKSARVNDQLFGSYVLFGDGQRRTLITSRRRTYPLSTQATSPTQYAVNMALSLGNLAITGSFVSIVGFVLQFVGVRALHWSASIAQLAVTLTMTAVRTWIRRNMSARPKAVMLPVDYEIDWLAVRFGTSLERLWAPGGLHPEHHGPGSGCDDNLSWEVITLRGYLGYEAVGSAHTEQMRDAKRILRMRTKLGYLTDWKGPSYPFAMELVACIQSLLSCFTTSEDIILRSSFENSGVFRWALPVKVCGVEQHIIMTANRSVGKAESRLPWSVDTFELCAVISLWCYRMKERGQAWEDTPDTHGSFWHRGDEALNVLRVLGPATRGFIHDCGQWMDRGGRFVVVENAGLRENSIEGQVTTTETKELSKRIAPGGHCTSEIPREHITPHRIMGVNPVDNESKESLAFVSTAPLKRVYAQEILSSFLWAIAGTVHSICGQTQLRGATPPGNHESMVDEWFDSKLENTFFQKVAEIISESGVTSNIQDAYALTIPPFANAGKLPGWSPNGLAGAEIGPIRPGPGPSAVRPD